MQQGDLTVVRHRSGVLVSTLPQAFQETAALQPDSVAIRTTGNEVVITWRQYADRVRKSLRGWRRSVSNAATRSVSCCATVQSSTWRTPPSCTSAQSRSRSTTLRHQTKSGTCSAMPKTDRIHRKDFLPAVKAAGADLTHVIVVDADVDGCLTLEYLESLGAERDFDFDSAWRAVRPDDVATLIYTSGTTGPPKGVELTHANVIAAFSAIVDLLDMQPNDRITSYLPHAHIADRVTGHYANMVLGVPVTDVADPRAIAEALPDARPTVWLGVPRVWNKIKAGIETKLGTEATGIKRRLALWAIDTGIRAARGHWPASRCPRHLRPPHDRRPPRAGKVARRDRPGSVAMGSNRRSAHSVETLEFFWGGHSRLRSMGDVGERGPRDVKPARREQGGFGRAGAFVSRSRQ